MFTVDYIPLTTREAELLDHRLAVPDCIADALAEHHSRDIVENAVARLRLFTNHCVIPTAYLSEVDVDVLADAVEGSTWVAAASAAAQDEDDPCIKLRAVRTIKMLATKLVESGIGICGVPTE